MVKHAPLTPRQLDVLRWVADGSVTDAWPDSAYKASVWALANRRLVSARRTGGKLVAQLLPDGVYYINHGSYPANATAGATNYPRPPATTAPRPAHPRSAATGRPGKPAKVKPPSPTDRLIADIGTAGGTLTLDCGSGAEENRIRGQVQAAKRFGKVPVGSQLVMTYENGRRQLRISLVPIPDWATRPIEPIRVLGQLGRLHPAVAALRRDKSALDVSRDVRERALRLLQALVVAATSRGYAVLSRDDAPHEPWAHLYVSIHGFVGAIRVREQTNRSEHIPTPTELAARQRYAWSSIPKYDYTPNGLLRIDAPARHGFPKRWNDKARTSLDEQLGEVLQHLELRATEHERAMVAAEQRRAADAIRERERLVQAQLQREEDHRIAVLNQQLAAWQRSRQLTEFLAAMEEVVRQLPDDETAAEGHKWLEWCRRHANETNPLHGKLAMPAMTRSPYAFLYEQ